MWKFGKLAQGFKTGKKADRILIREHFGYFINVRLETKNCHENWIISHSGKIRIFVPLNFDRV